MDTIKIILQTLTIVMLGILFYTIVGHDEEQERNMKAISSEIHDINERLNQWEAE